MASYVVMEPPAAEGAEDRAVLVRDGFHFLAFVLPAVWLLFHRLWLEALAVVVVTAALSALGSVAGLGSAAPVLSLLVSVYVGLEGAALKLARYRRRGWREWGVVEAANAADAEIRYLAEAESGAGEPDDAPLLRPAAMPAVPSTAPRREAGPALGLFAYPGKS